MDTSAHSKDSLLGFEHRDDAKDSINISFHYLDSIRNIRVDSSINDFYRYFTVPEAFQNLGTNGSAGYSLIFSPLLKAGWDAGFHAFDAYRYTLEDTRFFKTNKPFSQLDYQLASGKEQTVHVLYTNNLKRNLNVGFEYKLISSPGLYVTQNTNHNGYRLFTNYQGKRKRYSAYLAIVGNSLKSSENGGIRNDSFLHNSTYKERFTIPVNLGGSVFFQPNPFNVAVNTGNLYTDASIFLRQSYDIGKKDSIDINDSTTEYLFYPKLRFQYSFTYSTYNYLFKDNAADSGIYSSWYNILLPFGGTKDTFSTMTKWKMTKNDFSLIQFPDTKNQAQFFLLGARLENFSGMHELNINRDTSKSATYYFHNIVLHAEYRNKTRNRLWDIEANGELYANGLNSGDYNIYATLARTLNGKFGNIRLTFHNVNRSQSFIFNPLFSFNNGTTANYAKENISVFQASASNSFIGLSATDYFINNFAYFTDYYHTAQYAKLINLLQLSASKKIKLSKHWNWYIDLTLQQTDAAAPIKVPLLFARNRIAYEGTFYKNLNISTGVEFRYYTPYKEYNYSPILGQFMPQDTLIKNRPDISAFLQFRIRSFTAFVRTENLNAISFTNGFGFTENNFGAPHYPYPGFVFRLGIRWWFVN